MGDSIRLYEREDGELFALWVPGHVDIDEFWAELRDGNHFHADEEDDLRIGVAEIVHGYLAKRPTQIDDEYPYHWADKGDGGEFPVTAYRPKQENSND